MLTFRADKEKNIIFVNIMGMTPKEKMGEAIADFTQKCSKMRSHFTIINDMSLYKSQCDHDLEMMCKLTQMLFEKFDIGKIIRIVGKNTKTMDKLLEIDAQLGLKNIYYATDKKVALEILYKFTH